MEIAICSGIIIIEPETSFLALFFSRTHLDSITMKIPWKSDCEVFKMGKINLLPDFQSTVHQIGISLIYVTLEENKNEYFAVLYELIV